MWQVTHTQDLMGIDPAAIWDAWCDVERWPAWDPGLEWARRNGAFATGETFTLRPKGGPTVTIALERVEPLRGFTDCTRFPLARMYGVHDVAPIDGGVRLTVTMRVEGPLAWLWRRLVAQKIADDTPEQFRKLAAYISTRPARHEPEIAR